LICFGAAKTEVARLLAESDSKLAELSVENAKREALRDAEIRATSGEISASAAAAEQDWDACAWSAEKGETECG